MRIRLDHVCFAVFACLTLGSCRSSLDDQYERIEEFAKSNRIGSATDMWLVKDGLAGPERVALIFGFVPDSEVCEEVAFMYNRKYPNGGKFTCHPAN